MPRAVFLDRDDTLIEARSLAAPPAPASPGDVFRPEWVRLLPGAAEACRALKGAGFTLVVISNQGSVARGAAALPDIERTNDRIRELLCEADTPAGRGRPAVLIDAFYFCPFHPHGRVGRFTGEHEWRKPNPGMILAAARELRLDLGESWLVGDAERDARAGVAGGLRPERCLLLAPGSPLADLRGAAEVILGGRGAVVQ